METFFLYLCPKFKTSLSNKICWKSSLWWVSVSLLGGHALLTVFYKCYSPGLPTAHVCLFLVLENWAPLRRAEISLIQQLADVPIEPLQLDFGASVSVLFAAGHPEPACFRRTNVFKFPLTTCCCETTSCFDLRDSGLQVAFSTPFGQPVFDKCQTLPSVCVHYEHGDGIFLQGVPGYTLQMGWM